MKIAILGAGGVGGYYGALLARDRQQVFFIARGAHLQAIRDHGLRIESVHGDMHIQPAEATDDPAEVGPADLILVSVKNYDLEQAAHSAQPLIGPQSLVIPLLNGLEASERLARAWGTQHVLGGLTHISSAIVKPGIIRQTSQIRRITFGERDGSITSRCERLQEVLSHSGIEAVLTPEVDVHLWSKFLFITSISGVCCIARQPIGSVLRTPETRQLCLAAFREIEAIARARGVALPEDAVEQALGVAEGFAPETKPSLLVDLEAGKRLELEALNGAVVRHGEDLGIETPVHSVIYAALKPSATPT
jgi:2-dehydropantoate 2-reductase